MLKLTPRQLARQQKFRKLGAAISSFKKIGDPDAAMDYGTGKPSRFAFSRYDAFNRAVEVSELGIQFCRWPKDRCEVPYGPEFKTPQWERTVR